jgi:nitrite reductase/ring-hydroxylating ferredoxin subunit/DMSO/TMAO reductase YedYZ heme-binding membrane subunit
MSVQYRAVSWNAAKQRYDLVLAAGVALYLLIFAALGAALHPSATAETLLIRGLGTAALILLHIILAIGPLCRLAPRFLPLLYNRRHLGVTMFLLSLAHAGFSVFQFHALGNVNPVVSVFLSNPRYDSLHQFPFEVLGAGALGILFLMAATSHDFWLRQLSPAAWKSLHMAVYLAWSLLLGHVALGPLQSNRGPVLPAVLIAGAIGIAALHLAGAIKEFRLDRQKARVQASGFVEAGRWEEIEEGRARVICAGGERIAIFRHQGQPAALGNVCAHQGGPLGEGRIIDGCVTCPWHGFQYLPLTGGSPPPFKEKVPSYETQLIGGFVYVHPIPKERR